MDFRLKLLESVYLRWEIFSLLFQTNGLLYEIGMIMSNMKRYILQNSVQRNQSFYEFCLCSIWHIFLCSGLSRYLFLPELSKLTKRSEFPELLFTAASNYRNQGENSSCLPAIREPVWLYLRGDSSGMIWNRLSDPTSPKLQWIQRAGNVDHCSKWYCRILWWAIIWVVQISNHRS